MITDAQTRFSDRQAITSSAVVSTNSYDTGSASRDIGRGMNLRMRINADVAFAGGTSVRADIIQSANADLSSGTVISTGDVIPLASLTAGGVLMDRVLPKTSQRYIGVQYTPVGTFTAGTVTAGLVLDSDSGDNFVFNTGF